jgi:predicted MFS family arabinose efflux permease
VRPRFTGLWRHPDFLKLWGGGAVSALGSGVSGIALPLTAVLALGATPGQMGLMVAAERVPVLVFGLLAGVWLDRVRRRPVLIGTDVGRALVLGSVPVAALLGALRIEQLYAVAFAAAFLSILFDVAWSAYLPAVGRPQLVEANSRFEVSRAASQVVGPGLGRWLVQILGAPVAVAADALSFVLSGLCVWLVRAPEPAPPPRPEGRPIRDEIGEGLRAQLAHPLLRPLAAATALSLFGYGMLLSLYVLYMTRLGLEPVAIGLVVAVGGPAGLLGAVPVRAVARRSALGRTLGGVLGATAAAQLFIPLAALAPPAAVVPLLMGAGVVGGLVSPIDYVTELSLRQAVTPDRLLARVGATARVVISAAMLLGGLVGGVLGDATGVLAALVVAALAPVVLVLSPVRGLRDAPAPVSESSPAPA